MSRMDWDRVRREDRVARQGSDPIWNGLPGPTKKKQKKSQKTAGTPSRRRTKAATARRTPKQPGSVPGDFGYAVAKTITESKGWISAEEVARRVTARGLKGADGGRVTAAAVIAVARSHPVAFEVAENHIRMRKSSKSRHIRGRWV